MIRNNGMRWLLAAVFLLAGAAGESHAKPVLQEDFRGPAPKMVGRQGAIVGNSYEGPGGEKESGGTWLEYDLQGIGFNPNEGTIELDVTRSEKEPFEALASFVDENGVGVVTFGVYWEGYDSNNPRATAFNLEIADPEGHTILTKTKDDMGLPALVPGAYLQGRVTRGHTVHVAVSWGPSGVRIFVDGNQLQGQTNALKKLQALLGTARKLTVGGLLDSVRIPGGAYGMSASLIANVQIHDRQLQARELAQLIVGAVPLIAEVGHNAFTAAGFSGKLVAGNNLQVTLAGTPGCHGSLRCRPPRGSRRQDRPRLAGLRRLPRGQELLRGRRGRPARRGGLRGLREPRRRSTSRRRGWSRWRGSRSRSRATRWNSSSKDTPYYVAVLAEMRDGTVRTVMAPRRGSPMTESSPGRLRRLLRRRLARIATRRPSSSAGWPRESAASVLVDPKTFAIDPSLTIAVAAEPKELKADEKSTSTVTVTVTDANGNAGGRAQDQVPAGDDLAVHGGGRRRRVRRPGRRQHHREHLGRDRSLRQAHGDLRRRLRREDGGHRRARHGRATHRRRLREDLHPGDRRARARAGGTAGRRGRGLRDHGDLERRVADRRRQEPGPDHGEGDPRRQAGGGARCGLRRLLRRGHDPDREGHDRPDGEARAVYTAGKKIGIALITATDTTVGISGSVQIELRSDAPAKIAIKIDPEKLPADGRSRADLLVLVTDINDNPNDNVEVEYRDRAGRRPPPRRQGPDRPERRERDGVRRRQRRRGRVSIEITVRSTVPTAEEIAKANDLALSAKDPAFF